MKEFLASDGIDVPLEFKRNARRFLYYQLFRTSLPFGEFLEPSVRTTQTRLKSFGLEELSPARSEAMKVIKDGVLEGGDFLLEEDELVREFSAWEAASDEDSLNFEKENLK